MLIVGSWEESIFSILFSLQGGAFSNVKDSEPKIRNKFRPNWAEVVRVKTHKTIYLANKNSVS